MVANQIEDPVKDIDTLNVEGTRIMVEAVTRTIFRMFHHPTLESFLITQIVQNAVLIV